MLNEFLYLGHKLRRYKVAQFSYKEQKPVQEEK